MSPPFFKICFTIIVDTVNNDQTAGNKFTELYNLT